MAKRKGPTPKKRPEATPGGIAFQPSRKFGGFNPNSDDIRAILEKLPKGLVAVLANESARYTSFTTHLMGMILPLGSRVSFHTGCYVVDSSNRAVLGMAEDEDWIMFMGDDHAFHPMFAVQLLALMYHNQLDVIAPLCFKRSFPPAPVLYTYNGEVNPEKSPDEADLLEPLKLSNYPKGGLVEVYAAGTAGMIVRAYVLREMERQGLTPFFELGKEQWGEDLDFCRKVRLAGFKIWADLDNSLGHIINTTIWPVRNLRTGEWACQYDHGTQGGYNLAL